MDNEGRILYKVRNKRNGKEWGYLSNRQDAENAIAHFEDMHGWDYRDFEIIEVKE